MNSIKNIRALLATLIFILSAIPGFSFGQSYPPSIPKDGNIYLSPELGKDTNNGTKESPLKSLSEAAKRVNTSEGEGAINIYLLPGVYGLTETADFNPTKWKFSASDRLTVRAETLPDNEKWKPSDMPVLISTMPFSAEKNNKGEITGGQNFGILVQNSHVTIQGLRILGEPVHENPSNGVLIRNYPIVWEGKNLEDFRVTQCMFIGSRYAVPNHLAILANGKALEVDHCVFHGVKDAVVMWNSPASNSSMHHNLIIDSYGGVVWTWSATEDFKFYNNVISNANVLWILDKDEKFSYTVENSIVAGYNSLVNKGGGAQGFGEKADPAKLSINKNVVLKTTGKLEIIEDQTSRNYLHIKPGTLGADLGAGLFFKYHGQQHLIRAFQPSNIINKTPYGANTKAGHYVQANDAKIYYEVYGKGQPIILLHGGLFGSTIEMADFIDSLQQDFQVIAISTRGHGKSALGTEPVTLEQRANDAMAVINAVTKDSVMVLGFSDGGYTAYQLVAMHPDRIKKMIVMGAGELYPGLRAFNFTAKQAVEMDKAYWEQQLKLMPDPDRLEEMFAQVSNCYSKATVGKMLLGTIKCPVLVLSGDRDQGNTVEHVVNAARMIPKHQICIIPNTSHTVFLENFAAVWASVVPFLKQ